MLDHLDYVARNFGVDHVAIGTDVAYVSSAAGPENRKIPSRRRLRSGWEHFWRPNDALSAAEWNQEHQRLSLAWTNWPVFTIGLVQRGYTDEEIQKILGGNVLRVARAVWPG